MYTLICGSLSAGLFLLFVIVFFLVCLVASTGPSGLLAGASDAAGAYGGAFGPYVSDGPPLCVRDQSVFLSRIYWVGQCGAGIGAGMVVRQESRQSDCFRVGGLNHADCSSSGQQRRYPGDDEG